MAEPRTEAGRDMAHRFNKLLTGIAVIVATADKTNAGAAVGLAVEGRVAADDFVIAIEQEARADLLTTLGAELPGVLRELRYPPQRQTTGPTGASGHVEWDYEAYAALISEKLLAKHREEARDA